MFDELRFARLLSRVHHYHLTIGDGDDGTAPGAGGEPAPTDFGRMDKEAAVALLAGLEDAPDGDAAANPGASDQASIEPPSEDDKAAAADEQSEETADDDAAEIPADDAEPELEAEPDERIHGNTRTRLRDGTVVTIAELKKGYDEAREYRAKAPEYDAAQKQIEQYRQHEAQIAQAEQLYKEILPLAVERLQATLPAAPDPGMLDETNPNYDPIRYLQEDQRHKLAVAELQKLRSTIQERQKQEQRQQEEARAAELQKLVAENRSALVEKIPELADPEKGKAVYDGFVDVAGKYGFTKQEVDQTYDHRLLYMVHDLSKKAAAYDKLMAQKPVAQKKVEGAAPVQRPGVRVSPEAAGQRAIEERVQAWDRGGRSKAGAIAILEMLERE